jgi:tetratricopeptide (TPR) repeat protein
MTSLVQQDPTDTHEDIIANDFIYKFESLDNKCLHSIGEEIIDLRIQQLTYAKLLCNVFNKDQYYMVKGLTQLGLAYLDIEYYEQAQEHLLTAYRLNSRAMNNDLNMHAKEFELRISKGLAKCYLETNQLKSAIDSCEKSLLLNKAIIGDWHISNAEIYFLLAKV